MKNLRGDNQSGSDGIGEFTTPRTLLLRMQKWVDDKYFRGVCQLSRRVTELEKKAREGERPEGVRKTIELFYEKKEDIRRDIDERAREIYQELDRKREEAERETDAKFNIFDSIIKKRLKSLQKLATWVIPSVIAAGVLITTANYYTRSTEADKIRDEDVIELRQNLSREIEARKELEARLQQQFKTDREIQDCIYQSELYQQRQASEEALAKVREEAAKRAELFYGRIGDLEGSLAEARRETLDIREESKAGQSALSSKLGALSYGFAKLDSDLRVTQADAQTAIQMSREVQQDYGARIAQLFYTTDRLAEEIDSIPRGVSEKPLEPIGKLSLEIPKSELEEHRLIYPKK